MKQEIVGNLTQEIEKLKKEVEIAKFQLYDEPVYEARGLCAHKLVLKNAD